MQGKVVHDVSGRHAGARKFAAEGRRQFTGRLNRPHPAVRLACEPPRGMAYGRIKGLRIRFRTG